jgi:hypothetical protein
LDIRNLIRFIACNAYLVYDSCLTGNPSSKVSQRFKKISHPEPGDYVLEISSFDCEYDVGNRVGILIQITQEPIWDWNSMDEETKRLNEYNVPEDIPKDKYYYIETLEGKLQRWHNCQFIKIISPYEFNDHIRTDGWREPRMYTKEEIVQGLKVKHNLVGYRKEG